MMTFKALFLVLRFITGFDGVRSALLRNWKTSLVSPPEIGIGLSR
jgi:hypothetical protein